MSVIVLLSRLLKTATALLRTLNANRSRRLGKELARGEMDRRHNAKLEKAALARRSIRDQLRDPDRLRENDGKRRD